MKGSVASRYALEQYLKAEFGDPETVKPFTLPTVKATVRIAVQLNARSAGLCQGRHP